MVLQLKATYDKQEDIPEAFRELYAEQDEKFVLTGIEGIRTQHEMTKLTNEAYKERVKYKEHRDKLAAWNALGKTPEEVQELLDKVPELEAAAAGKVVDETKIEALVTARVNKQVVPLQRQAGEKDAKIKELTDLTQTLQGERVTRTIHDTVRAAATKLRVIPEALPDVLMLAERMLEIEEDGKSVRTKDQVGVTPGVAPEVWLIDMQKTRPHWWPPSQGTGAQGGSGGGGFTGDNPFARDTWNLTKQGQIITQDPKKAEQLMKQAGCPGPGIMPPEKKQK
jgi:hypothetical protein